MANTSLGYLKVISLNSILSMIEMDQESWTLRVNSDGRIGSLYFLKGQIVDAETQGLTGSKAALEILSWEDSVVQISDTCPRQQTIQISVMNILLEACRIKDEFKKELELEKKLYDEATAHIIAFRPQKGQEILISILRKNPRFYKGWLWYSRTLATMKDIGSALNNAHRLAPGNEEIKADKEKFITAESCIQDPTVKRCPFCWTPLNQKAQACFSCGLQLIIVKALLEQPPKDRNAGVIDQSVKRFSLILEKEKNLYAAYYMAMAHYNMNDQDRTLELLNDTITMSGGRPFFKNQLKLFLHQSASQKAVEPELVITSAQAASGKKQKTILVVEDSPTTRKVITLTLNMMGYKVLEASDGLQALSRLSEEKPDLVLLDIILPKMNGYEILSIIKNKREFKRIPVIMLTGRDGFMNKMKGKIAGATAYITKPFQPEDLVKAIEKYI